MDHFRPRKYRGPETWARVKVAYLAGEPAPSVALRFDVGEANLKKRALREGWTRRAWALKHDLKPVRGEPDPPEPAVGPLEPPPLDGDPGPPRPDATEPTLSPLEAADLDLEERALKMFEEQQRATERRRAFAREAELREAEHQAQLASLQASPALPAPASPDAAGALDPQPGVETSAPIARPKKSFEERVREASGNSGPVSRW